MLPLACLAGDLKSGASVADLILTMGLTPKFLCPQIKKSFRQNAESFYF
jgi:hypothetical protein